jgi:hypothetical protein
VALCAHITIPLMPLTPVPLTAQNLGVLLVGLMLGSRRGFAALALYLAEGAVGNSFILSTNLCARHSVLFTDRDPPLRAIG